MRQRIAALFVALVSALALGVLLPAAPASAAPVQTVAPATACAVGWSSSAVFTGGESASYNGHNWLAQWWTQGETPGVAAVWTDQGACDGGTVGGGGNCDYPAWVAGQSYVAGDIVEYTNGGLYQALHDNPGYDPTISTWYWQPYTCSGGGNPPPAGGFVVSESQFDQMFPNRNPFYTYDGLTAALSAYPGFATTGSDTVQRQEAAAFLANVAHETSGLLYVVEQNTANYPDYCDTSQSYGCPAGQAEYYGRGPLQISWNFNYKAAGDALGIDLLDNPNLVQTDSAVAWKTALWYWDTQTGPGTMTPHNAMVNGAGFGETIRSINGSIECNGGNPAEVQDRINYYQSFTQLLGTTPGANLSC